MSPSRPCPAVPVFLTQDSSRLRYAQLDGVYVSITPGDPSLWVGVVFVRKGPYAPAVLRFQVAFPAGYPALPPLVTFSTDVFHPLLTPLTTYTYTTAAAHVDTTVSATDEERLPPGGFSLRHGFPHWFGRAQKSLPNSCNTSRGALTPSRCVTSGNPVSDQVSDQIAPASSLGPSHVSMVSVLEYIQSTFHDASVLDALPLEAAANPGAYHAWRTYRGLASQTRFSSHDEKAVTENSTLSRNRRPGAWNWEGVWEDRVRKAVKASLSEPVLYGTHAGEDIIHFCNNSGEVLEKIRA